MNRLEFWRAVFSWLMMIGYVFSLFAKPHWYFSFDERIPQINELSMWWNQKGYPEWLLLGIRFIVISFIMYLLLKMGIRGYQNA